MYTRLEIVIKQDGTLHRVGVVRTSGFLPFDHGAWNAVNLAAPFSEPPKKILSGDGRVYVHWDFHRNDRQCGTFNAQPFILPKAGGAPVPLPSPFQDEDPHEHEEEHEEGQQDGADGHKFWYVRPREGSSFAQGTHEASVVR
jgi:TonB family protein